MSQSKKPATDEEVQAAVIKCLKRLKSEGKDLFAGYFAARNGQVILTVTRCGEGNVSINYSCYSQMWMWVMPEADLSI